MTIASIETFQGNQCVYTITGRVDYAHAGAHKCASKQKCSIDIATLHHMKATHDRPHAHTSTRLWHALAMDTPHKAEIDKYLYAHVQDRRLRKFVFDENCWLIDRTCSRSPRSSHSSNINLHSTTTWCVDNCLRRRQLDMRRRPNVRFETRKMPTCKYFNCK